MAFFRLLRKYARTGVKTSLVCIGYYSRPRFLIIGAQKCGTVALFRYLSKHPKIIPANKKEISFFDQDNLYSRGQAWYHNHFPLPHRFGRDCISFEATPEYLYYPLSAERIFSYDHHIKLIVLLRDPVERAFSAWNMFRNKFDGNPERFLAKWRQYDEASRNEMIRMLSGESFPEFDEVVRDEIDKMISGDSKIEPSFVRRGIYYDQLLRHFKYFERSQILIIDSQLLKINKHRVLNEVIRFLDLPEYNWCQEELLPFHVGTYVKQMSCKTLAFLRKFYKPHNKKLYELLDRDFGWQ